MKSVRIFAAFAILISMTAACGTGTGVVKSSFTIQLLHFADIDGNETAALDSVDAFSALVEAFRNDPTYGSRTIIVSSGDNMIPGPRYFAAEQGAVRDITGSNEPGHADHVIMRALGVMASAVGNHELDQGPGEFADSFIGDDLQPGFPYLAANIDFTGVDDFVIGEDGADYTELAGKTAASAVVRIAGEPVGIVGASTPALDTITSVGRLKVSGGGSTADLAAAIQPAVDALTERGVNKIILLSHMQQIAVEREPASMLTDVDIIVAGGSGTLLADENDRLRPGDSPADTYPVRVFSPKNELVLVVNVPGDYQYLGRLVVSFDKRGVILEDMLDESINGAWASTSENAEALGGTPMPEIRALGDALKGVIASQFGNVAGYTKVYLEGRRGKRTEETNLGNLSADANLWYANVFSEVHVVVSEGEVRGNPNRVFRIVTLNFLANGGDAYPFPGLSAPNRSQLYAGTGYGDPDSGEDGIPDFPVESQSADPGRSGTFSHTGGEQDALAEYLAAFHGTPGEAYDTTETQNTEDLRMQNLSVRSWATP